MGDDTPQHEHALEPAPDEGEIFEAIAALPQRPVPPGLAASFRQRLTEQGSHRSHRRPALLIAIAAILVLAVGAGWWHERQRRLAEEQQLHAQLATALQSLSTATRLKAISATVDEGQRGATVENALIAALLDDPSTNVRMAAAAALGRIARPDVLHKAVRRALAVELSPFVQMTLLNTTAQFPIADQRSALSALLARTDVDPMIMNDARARVRDKSQGDSR